MRSELSFKEAFDEVKWFVNFHNKPVWLKASEDKYVLSIIKPEPHELPTGTAANLYSADMEVLVTVKSSNVYK